MKIFAAIERFYSFILQKFNDSLIPKENNHNIALYKKILLYSFQLFTEVLPFGALLILFVPLRQLLLSMSYLLKKHPPLSPFKTFEKNPDWSTRINSTIALGVATSEYQINGSLNYPYSTWALWEKSTKKDGSHCIDRGDTSGYSLNFWHYPDHLIKKLKEIGVKHYRLSVEWSAIEHEKNIFSEDALNYYVDLCHKLKDEKIEPLITLHHFSDPQWFLKLGGFEEEGNIESFTEFAKKIYALLSPTVKEWITFNEPTIYAFQGYIRGEYPPGVRSLKRAGIVLKNLLKAHCAVYDALKILDTEGTSKIGIAHQALRFRPYHPLNLFERLTCFYLSEITHQSVMDFFKTGKFQFHIPFTANVNFLKKDIQEKLDFFGIQYYTDPLISMKFSRKIMESTCYPDEKMTHMPYRFYPQGLASVLEECKEIHKPIWITETGAAAEEEDQREFLEKALRTASFAKMRGVPIERLHVWTLEDNFEWNMGWQKKFGLFSFDPKTQESKMRLSGKFFKQVVEQSLDLKMVES